MRLEFILIMVVTALILRSFSKSKYYDFFLALVGICILFLLQPVTSVRYLNFWLPSIAIGLVIFSWLVITPRDQRSNGQTVNFFIFSLVLVQIFSLIRYTGWSPLVNLASPPFQVMFISLILFSAVFLFMTTRRDRKSVNYFFYASLLTLITVVFIVQKSPTLNQALIKILRGFTGQSISTITFNSIQWFGISYILFRLLHTILDWKNGRLVATSLPEYFNYVLFFPTLSAGPIDRLDRFHKDYKNYSGNPTIQNDLIIGGKRILTGIFKKFVIADNLALIAMNSTNISLVKNTSWLWLLLYAYAFQLFFDFAGYSDIAIGIGKILGINVPENFDTPYLKQNLTLFWNSWHMTLTKWVQSYVFNPLSRKLRSSYPKLSPRIGLLIGQVVTMVFIGLWHGISTNFIIWGLWHALGLFVSNQITLIIRKRNYSNQTRQGKIFLKVIGTFLTFNYVALGWVWFAFSDTLLSVQTIMRLFGRS